MLGTKGRRQEKELSVSPQVSFKDCFSQWEDFSASCLRAGFKEIEVRAMGRMENAGAYLGLLPNSRRLCNCLLTYGHCPMVTMMALVVAHPSFRLWTQEPM